MQMNLHVRKWFVIGIILLFIGTSIIPVTAQDREKPSLPTSNGHWLYVGGSGPGNHTTIQSVIHSDVDSRTGQLIPSYDECSRQENKDGSTNDKYTPGELTRPFFNVTEIAKFGQTVWGLASADFNNDGYMDFAVSWATNPWTMSGISIFYNNGNGSFTRDDVYFIKTTLTYIYDLSAGDYNNDRHIDILYTCDEITWIQGIPYNTNGTVNLLVNNGENKFIESRMVAWLGPNKPGDPKSEINPQLASADFNKDGNLDFIVGSDSGKVELFLSNGRGNFTSAGIIYDYGYDTLGVAAGDFNNDGWVDFIVVPGGNETNHGHIYLNYNRGPPQYFDHTQGDIIADLPIPDKFRSLGLSCEGPLVALDYNNDGWLDFLYVASHIMFLFMNNKGVFTPFYVCYFPNGPEGYAEDLTFGALTAADFNNDGRDDLVTGGVQGFVRLFLNNCTLIDIVRPQDMWWYKNNVEQYRMFEYPGNCLAIGPVRVVAEGLEELQKVEFYLNGQLMVTDYTPPYEWLWNRLSFGKYIVTAVAYNADGVYSGKDSLKVWKFL